MTAHPYLAKWYRYCPSCKTTLKHQSKKTTSCPKCNFIFYNNPATAVVILLTNDKGEVLLGKRRGEPQKNYWDNPGGFVDAGETAEQTVIREMKEETGLKIEIVDYLGSIDDVYGIGPTLNLVYVVKKISGEIEPSDDVVELRWFAIDQIPWNKVAFANTRSAIEMLQKQHRQQ